MICTKSEILQDLIDMSRWLGDETRALAILGEGNTSAKTSDSTFYVKASGCQLGNITAEGLVEVDSTKVLKMLDGPALSDTEIKALLKEAIVDKEGKFLPSIETLFHAYLLTIPGVNFVGHTHPISVNSILCTPRWKEITSGRLFPDEIVCCGLAPVYLEYTDPGVGLGRAMRDAVEGYIKEYGMRPKAVLMQNHGLVALGSTAKEVQSISAMWDKTAKVLAGTFIFGGPRYMSASDVDRIAQRPDEEQRKKMIEGRG